MKRYTVVLASMAFGALLAFGVAAAKNVLVNTGTDEAVDVLPKPATCQPIATSELVEEYASDSALRQALENVPEQMFLRCK